MGLLSGVHPFTPKVSCGVKFGRI